MYIQQMKVLCLCSVLIVCKLCKDIIGHCLGMTKVDGCVSRFNYTPSTAVLVHFDGNFFIRKCANSAISPRKQVVHLSTKDWCWMNPLNCLLSLLVVVFLHSFPNFYMSDIKRTLSSSSQSLGPHSVRIWDRGVLETCSPKRQQRTDNRLRGT